MKQLKDRLSKRSLQRKIRKSNRDGKKIRRSDSVST
jgi:hypothetical protein